MSDYGIPDVMLSYGPLPDHVVDIRLPTGQDADPAVSGPRPLIVIVHGGFWKAEWDRSHTGPQGEGLTAAGYVVATVEFRRVGMPGGGFPGTLDDIALMADTVPGLIAEALPGRVDASRTVFVGHSAGGHLALWAASRHRLPEGSRWHRPTALPISVVSLAGVIDLALAHRLGLGDGAVDALLDGQPGDHPDRYAETDPARLLPTGIPTVLIHGIDDEPVPLAVTLAYAAAATAAGEAPTVHVLRDTDHMALVDPTSTAWPTLLTALQRLTT